MSTSPLGRFSEPAALITALGLVLAWTIVQLAVVFGAVGVTSPALDAAATLAVGILLGQRSTTNGAGKLAVTAHKRLDAMGAPPAADVAPTPTPDA